MIHEIVVTSAARGLQAGRSGFTTVLRTRGIHPELQAKLEQGSAYRHVYPQGDPRNPRILSHTLVQSPAGRMSVLSSIVDAGNGYDGRSNKLAHHIALDGGESAARVASSPAAVLLAIDRNGGFLRRWSGEPREQAAAATIPGSSACEPSACSGWARAAGDAGWAGFIVERALRREPTWIIVAAGVDLMELFDEALALAAPAQRWTITFTTYAVGQPDVLWMGTVDGSPEAQAARGQSRVAVVDLVRKPSLTAKSALIDAARGQVRVPWLAEPAALTAAATTAATGVASGGPIRPPPIAGRPGAPPPLANPFSFSTAPQRAARGGAAGSERKQKETPRSWLPVALGVVASAVAAALIGLAVFAYGGRAQKPAPGWPLGNASRPRDASTRRPSQPPPDDAVARGGSQRQSGEPREDFPPRDDRLRAPSGRLNDPVSSRGQPGEAAAESGAGPPVPAGQPQPPPPAAPPPPAPPVADAFPNLRKNLAAARHWPGAGLDGSRPEPQETRLCALGGAKVVPRLPGVEFSLAAGNGRFRLSCVPDAENAWKIICSPAGPAVAAAPLHIGGVSVRDDALVAGLSQLPAPNDPRFPEYLGAREAVATTILVLANADDSQDTTYVQLRRPVEAPPIVIEQFFFDKDLCPPSTKRDSGEAVRLFLQASLPATPWPCTIRVSGKSVTGDLAGEIVESVSGQPSGGVQLPSAWTIEWSTGAGKPVMRTAFQLANKEMPDTGKDPSQTQFWLQSSDVLEPWNSFRSCADLNQARPPRYPMHQLPRVSLLKIGSEVPADSDDDQVGFPLIKNFSDVCKQYPKAPLDLTPFQSEDKMSVSDWKNSIRSAISKSTEYRAWVDANDPGPRPDPPGDWNKRNQVYDEARNATPLAIGMYWEHLKEKQDRSKTTHADVALCCLLEELDAIPAQKQEAKALIESLGEGDAEFRGEIVAEFKPEGRCVLVVLGVGEPGFVSSKKPIPSAQRDKSRTQRPAGVGREDRLDVSPPASL